MIDLNSQIKPYFENIDNFHKKFTQVNYESLPQKEIEQWESEMLKIQDEYLQFFKKNDPLIDREKDKELISRAQHFCKILTDDLDATQLTLMFKGRNVNFPIQSYIQKYPLEDRVLILGCGHDHHPHEGAYCIDINNKMMPDANIDIRSPLMRYLPTGSFSKVVLENLPTTIFNHNLWKSIFNQLHRILEANGKIQFNNMLGFETKSDFNNMFNLVISEDECKRINGKKIDDLPEHCTKYNEKLKNCFASVKFQFASDFDVKTMPRQYTVYKIAS